MPPSPLHNPIALPPLPLPSLITFLLNNHHPPTTLLICSSRETFLQDLQRQTITTTTTNTTTSPTNNNPLASSTTNDEPPSSPPTQPTNTLPHHPLLNPTLHLIGRSSTVKVAFTPTLAHLRAYMATYTTTTTADVKVEVPVSNPSVKPGSHHPMLAIWGLASLHRSTAEHSAQGLSRTLAAAVETAMVNGQRLVLAEASTSDGGIEDEGAGSSGDPWREQVPLLSGSVRFGGEERVWAGRTVEVRKVVGRWCRFVTIDDGG